MDSCNIKVAIKTRPLNSREQLDGRVHWKVESDSVIHVDPITGKPKGEQFFFDKVFCGKSTNYDVFDEIVKPIIDRGVQGFNGTVFAYGQTASGKTFTMTGDELNPGIIPLAINYMFNIMNSSSNREYLLRASYLEIYNEKIIDLLESKSQTRKIEIQKDGLHITPLKAIVCQHAQMVIDLMKIGEKKRSIGETNMNERSSRSHTIFRIILESRNIDDDCDGAYQQSVINLVDLAGSERSSQSQSSMERFKEGCKINSSLTTLGLVIQQLSECQDNSQHINFRDSKLTRILQTSLGGNSLTAIICTVTLAVDDQTHNTLSFASRAKKIKNTAKVNENVTDETLLKRYRVHISKLNKELEGIKQNQYEINEVNEFKSKYQEEKRTNEELKERIMRLQKNMITASVSHNDKKQNKKGYNRRRTWGGKVDSTFSSNSILETIEEDINMPRPSVPSNFGFTNKVFKTPLESFEWDLIREEGRTIDPESIPNENIENCDISPPCNISTISCETPRKVLRERANNYKSLFEMSLKENNELREYTTLEKQMFIEHNEQLKDLSNLRKQIDDLQIEKNESAKMIEKLKSSIHQAENEKRDVEVMIEVQKCKHEKRESELLVTIEETREELKSKEEQLKKILSSNTLMIEKQEEIKRLEMKIKEMSQLNNTFINEIETLKSQLLVKDQLLSEESTKLDKLLIDVAEIKSVSYAAKLLAEQGYFTLCKNDIEELGQLFEHIQNTVEQFHTDNQNLKDENNNLKLATNDYTNQLSNIMKENHMLKSELCVIETNIKSIIKDFSASNEIDVDNSDINTLIEFAVKHFEQITNEIDLLSNDNLTLKNDLFVSSDKLCKIESFVFSNLDDILQSISTIELKSSVESEKRNKKVMETLEENIFLKSSILSFNKLTDECVTIIEQVKTNQSHLNLVQEELTVSNAVKNELNVQLDELNEVKNSLKALLENQTKIEKEIQEELNEALTKINEMQLVINDNETKINLNSVHENQLNIELQSVKSDLESKSILIIELEEKISQLSIKYDELEKLYQTNSEHLEQKKETEKHLQEKLIVKTNELQESFDELKELKIQIELFVSEIKQLKTELDSVKFECDEKSKILVEVEKIKLELGKKCNKLEQINQFNKINTNEKNASLNEQLNIELDNKSEQLKELKIQIELFVSEIKQLKTELDSVKFECDEKSKILVEVEKIKLELGKKCNKLEQINQFNKINTNEKNASLNEQLNIELDNKSEQLKELKIQIELFVSEIKQLKTELDSVKFECDEKSKILIEVEKIKLELGKKCNKLEQINQFNKINTNEKNVSLNEKLNIELNNKSKLLKELEHSKLEINNHLEEIDKLNSTIIKLKSELDEKVNQEEVLKNELQIVTVELDDATEKVNEVKSVINALSKKYECNMLTVEELNNELKYVKSSLSEKNNLIIELEHINLELKVECKNSEEINQLNKIVLELEAKLTNQMKMMDELQVELHSKTTQLENAHIKEDEVQSLIESMENEIKLNIATIEQFKTELLAKSNLVAELEESKSEMLVKYNEIIETNLSYIKDDEKCKHLQDQLETVNHEKSLLQTELNMINQHLIKITKQFDDTKTNLKDKIQSQELNCQNLYEEFDNLSSDIESILKLHSDVVSELKKEILIKSTELDDLQKQINESSLQEDYDRLEEEYVLKSREVEEALEKIKNLQSMLLAKEESELNLRKNFKSKCKELEEHKKNVEFLCLRNDSFQVRVEDFEDEVLVDLNEEFDSMKSELAKKNELEKIILEEKAELEFNFKEIQEKLASVTKELKLSEERSEDLASIINVLVIEIKDANSVKENVESNLVDAEHELLKSQDFVESLENELYTVQREFENASIKIELMEKELLKLESKLNEKINNFEDFNDRNQLIDPLFDYVHDIKLKLTELNSAMISGSQSEKRLRTKVMSLESGYAVSLDETWKANCDSPSESSDLQMGFEIENLRKSLEDKTCEVNTLQEANNDMDKSIRELHEAKNYLEKNINDLQNQMKKISDEKSLVENDLNNKMSLINDLTNELNQIKKQYTELEEHNHATKDQIHHSLDIDIELRDGKKNVINEINLLEPGKITGVITHHNLSNLLDTFVNLIMTKEQQIVSDLINDHSKTKQQYEDQVKQLQEDIKKGKEWQEQVESDNEKIGLELENLKSQKLNFPNKEIEIKELKEKVLEAENQSFNYLSELQDLKTLFNKTNEENYQALSNEFEIFKVNSEQSIQGLKKKLEDLTDKYNESLSMYNDQKHSRSSLEGQIEKVQAERDCLKTVLEEKENDIKNLIDKIEEKTNEFEMLIEKNDLQREEMREIHNKKIDELQMELNEKTQEIHCSERSLKEITKKYNELVEQNSSDVLNTKYLQRADGSDVNNTVTKLKNDIQTITTTNETKFKLMETELKSKNAKLEETEEKCSKLLRDIEILKLKIISCEKQVESCYQTISLKDEQIKNYEIKLKVNENDVTGINQITDQLKKILKCTGTLSALYEKIDSLVTKCESLEEENEYLKLSNENLDSECESMLCELKNRDDRILEFCTQEDQMKKNIELLIEERDLLKNNCEQFKNVNNDIKKLNDEICSYEQSIYQLRREKGQIIMQHENEQFQLKAELNLVRTKNNELLDEYNKLSETAKNLEKSLKEDIQQLNRCIVDKNAKISTLELFSKTNSDELKKKNQELEHVYKRTRDENHMLRKELRRFKDIINVRKAEQCTQTEEQSVVSSAMVASNKVMSEKICKLENDNHVMKKMLHHRKIKIEELQKQLDERLC